MASITKIKGKKRTTYKVTIRIKGQPTICQTFDTEWEAVKWAGEVEAALANGGYVGDAPPKDLRFLEATRRYEAEVLPRKKYNTRMRELTILGNLENYFGKFLLSEINTQKIAEYRAWRERTVRASTILREFNVLSDMLTVARLDWGLDVTNTVRDARKPKKPRGRCRFLSDLEEAMLLDVACESDNPTLYHYIYVMLRTAMRPSECAGLRWHQIDWGQRGALLQDTKTGSPRLVPIARGAIEKMLQIRQQKHQGEEYIFIPRELSSQVSRRPNLYFRKSFATACRIAEIHDFTMHDLRHTGASRLLRAGADPRVLAEILGHSTMDMVMRYVHVEFFHARAAVDRMDRDEYPEITQADMDRARRR